MQDPSDNAVHVLDIEWCLCIAFDLTLLIMLASYSILIKHSKSKMINRLTLKPFYSSMCFLVMFLVQIAFVNIIDQYSGDGQQYIRTLILQLVSAIKAVLCSYTVMF